MSKRENRTGPNDCPHIDIYIYFYDLFNDAVSNSDHTGVVSNIR
jgi:hypothetical protein